MNTDSNFNTDTDTDPEALPDASQDTGAAVEVRLLVDCTYGAAGSVALIPAGQVAGGKAAGVVDDNPESIAYARRINAAKQPAATVDASAGT